MLAIAIWRNDFVNDCTEAIDEEIMQKRKMVVIDSCVNLIGLSLKKQVTIKMSMDLSLMACSLEA